MDAALRLLGLAARHGRILLVLGLIGGFVLPGLAQALRPWLPEMVAVLIGLAALRIGHRQAVGALRDLPRLLAVIGVFQLAAPLTVAVVTASMGLGATPVALALLLVAAAPPISGSPNLTALVGGDPAPSLRLLILATLLLPLTVIPAFAAAGIFDEMRQVLGAAARLLAVIGLAGAVGFAMRQWLCPTPQVGTLAAIDGLSALMMATVVIGLMTAVAPAVTGTPAAFAGWLALAFAANFGAQLLAGALLRRSRVPVAEQTAYGVSAGNRNIALFLASLPAPLTDPILLFIGCYQVPMYLTPLLLRRWYCAAPQTAPPR